MPCRVMILWNCLLTSMVSPYQRTKTNSSDLSAESGPDRAKLNTDDTGLRWIIFSGTFKTQGFSGRAHNRLLIDLDTGKGGDLRAGGNRIFLVLTTSVTPLGPRYTEWAGDGAVALGGEVTLFPLNSILMPPVRAVTALDFSHHLFEVKADLAMNSPVGGTPFLAM